MTEHTITLTGTYPSHDGDLTKLTLREPTARDYIEIPMPFLMKKHPDGAIETSVNAALVIRWTSRLTKVDQLILANLNRADMWQLISEVPAWIGSEADETNGLSEKN